MMKSRNGLFGETRLLFASAVVFCLTLSAFAQSSPDRVWVATGHSAAAYATAFSPAGDVLATGSDDCTIKLWRVADGALLRTLSGHGNVVRGIAYSPDGSLLVSGSADRTVKIWRVSDGALINTLSGHAGNVRTVAVSPDGVLIASGSDDKTVKLWNLASGDLVRTLSGHSMAVVAVDFSKVGGLLVSGSHDRITRVWRVSDGSLVRKFSGHSSYVLGASFSPDSSLVATASADTTVALWRVADGVKVMSLPCVNWAYSATFSPDGATLLSSDASYNLWIWRVSDGMLLSQQVEDSASPMPVFAPDGKSIGYGRADARVVLARSPGGGGNPPGNTAPTVTVISPADGGNVASGTPILFSASATDTQDGDVSASLNWSSSLDGVLGSGSQVVTTLSEGNHVITATATDSGGLPGAAVLSLVVSAAQPDALDVHVVTDKSIYSNRDNANIVVAVSDGQKAVHGSSVNVKVTTSKGNSKNYSAETDADGLAIITYRVNAKQGTGDYTVSAGASMSGYMPGSDATTFEVMP